MQILKIKIPVLMALFTIIFALLFMALDSALSNFNPLSWESKRNCFMIAVGLVAVVYIVVKLVNYFKLKSPL